MFNYCNPTLAMAGAHMQQLPPAAMSYVTQVLQVARKKPLGKRDSRELKTLAMCMDLLAKGELSRTGDVLMQRFKAVEQSSGDTPHEITNQFELVPAEDVTTISMREMEMASRQSWRKRKLTADLHRE